jgi:DNA gyrase/topoisomerase IV subunit B
VQKAIDKLKLKGIALAASKAKEQRLLASMNGSKCQRLKIPKLDDAPRAGTREARKCTIILTEGDSAKTFATSGICALELKERQYFGSFPLKMSRGHGHDRAFACRLLVMKVGYKCIHL